MSPERSSWITRRASIIDRFGLRRVVNSAIALLAVTVPLTTRIQTEWQLALLWGVLVGTGTGVTPRFIPW